MESVWSVPKLSTESVGSRRELCDCVHTADADATQLASAVCIGVLMSSESLNVSLLDALIINQLLQAVSELSTQLTNESIIYHPQPHARVHPRRGISLSLSLSA